MMDDEDDPLVDELRAWFAEADPVPPLVIEAAGAALGWRRLDAELAELLSDSSLELEPALARSGGAPVRSVSFGAGSVTIDVEIHVDGDERTLLGQLSPPAAARIDVQRADKAISSAVESDRLGRFRMRLGAGGPIRLRVTSGGAPQIETSWIAV